MGSAKLASRVLALALSACVAVALLASCAPAAQQKSAAQLNREYMSNVNRISSEAAEELAAFSDAVSAGDLASMRIAAEDASKALSKISALTPTEDLKPVHEEYTSGVSDLSRALEDYIALFASVKNGEDGAGDDSQAAASGLEEVQKTYQSGIDHLSKADSMVAEISGMGQTQNGEGAQGQTANAIQAAVTGQK